MMTHDGHEKLGGAAWGLTGREQALEALRKSETKYKTLYDSSRDAIMILTPGAGFLSGNPATVALFGCRDEAEFTSYSPADLSPPYQPDGTLSSVKAQQMMALALEHGSHFFPWTHQRVDGKQFFATVLLTRLELDGQPFLQATVRDITEQQLAAESLRTAKAAAEAANRAKSTFLATMSHEIRTPLNAILGFSQLLLYHAALPPQQRQQLETINRSGEHLLALINDVLEMSKIEAGRATLNPTVLDLYALFHDLETMFRLRADAKRLKFVMERAADLPRFAVSDESKLRQVLVNLLGNAMKFTERGTVALRVGVHGGPAGGLRLVVEVQDTGPGIAEHEVDRLFAPFEQAEAGRGVRSGTGLGLAISREHVRLLGGDLTVQSRVGQGSLFRFDVPLQESPTPPATAQREWRPVRSLQPGQPPPRVLIADDDDDSRVLLAEMLAAVGFEVRQVENGAQALREFEAWQPQLIFLDLRMPEVDGDEATRRIRATVGGQRIPILIISASAFEEERQAVLASGADEFIRKPYREQELFEKIAACCPVKYVYAQDTAPQETASPLPAAASLAPDAVPALPAQLVQQLRQAATTADLDRLLELLGEVDQLDRSLAEHLRKLAENYDYPALLETLGRAEPWNH